MAHRPGRDRGTFEEAVQVVVQGPPAEGAAKGGAGQGEPKGDLKGKSILIVPPPPEVVERLMKRFMYCAGVLGAMQVATLVIMTRIASFP